MKPSIVLFFILTLLYTGACTEKIHKNETVSEQNTDIESVENDSIALLQLTKNLVQWAENGNTQTDFAPLQGKKTDTLYTGLNMEEHRQRLQELKKTGWFTPHFLDNYHQIALSIQHDLENGNLEWAIGDMPPFGNGANYWCNCQDNPDDYLNKIWIMHLTITNNRAAFNWSWGDGLVYHVKALKENSVWKIDYLEGFDITSIKNSFLYKNEITGSWQNAMVILRVGNESLSFEYHGQCVYFYPVNRIDSHTFEMIWDRDMDCKFDNGTGQTFGLSNTPVIGQPFAKYTLKNNTLYATYYYPEWVTRYAEEIQTDVFTPAYERKTEN